MAPVNPAATVRGLKTGDQIDLNVPPETSLQEATVNKQKGNLNLERTKGPPPAPSTDSTQTPRQRTASASDTRPEAVGGRPRLGSAWLGSLQVEGDMGQPMHQRHLTPMPPEDRRIGMVGTGEKDDPVQSREGRGLAMAIVHNSVRKRAPTVAAKDRNTQDKDRKKQAISPSERLPSLKTHENEEREEPGPGDYADDSVFIETMSEGGNIPNQDSSAEEIKAQRIQLEKVQQVKEDLLQESRARNPENKGPSDQTVNCEMTVSSDQSTSQDEEYKQLRDTTTREKNLQKNHEGGRQSQGRE
ncbi:protein HEXIM2-like [Ambystoma mexicanum]|uniref:protein HEXIM2-like n=1 Tax=Ambystoma mexicanum TaxID=8296 RepID=UPI0037E99D2A